MTFDEEQLAFFHELGLAISQWSFVESGMYEIVAACTEPRDQYAMGFALFAVDNFRAKLAFCDAYLKKKRLDKARIATWDKLVDRLRNAAPKRNRLAHDRVCSFSHGRVGRRFALEDWPSNKPQDRIKPSSGDLCLRDIIAIRYEFFQLYLALQNFCAILLGQPEPHSGVGALPKNPPKIRTIRNQIRAALELPPLPSRKKP